ncbi:hypothetical protein RUND412_001495 [Rhizina undulata]
MPPTQQPRRRAAAGHVKQPPARASSSKTTTSSSTSTSRQAPKNAGKATGSKSTTAKTKPTTVVASSGSAAEHPPAQNKKTGDKRKAAEAVGDDEEEEEEEEEDGNGQRKGSKMPMLKPRIRSVPQEVVTTKWGSLSEKGQEEVIEVLKLVERPVIMTFRKESKRVEAQTVLQGLMRKLRSSLPKLPVPPTGKDVNLNLEKLIDKNRELEALLEPDMRHISELQAEIEKETKALEMDRKKMAELSRNAQMEQNVRRQKLRATHPLLKQGTESGSVKDGVDDINLSIGSNPGPPASSYDVRMDRQILPLTAQLQQHLTSMQGNSGSLGEVTEWMQRSRAAVDEVLLERAGNKVYDKIIGL